ncbi:MAG: hypothetical protein KF887_09010 [Paracoccaceae bacterium]|nr:MAG: hypothetical protein KF887_09010 [Paracoccaceae bacterium]
MRLIAFGAGGALGAVLLAFAPSMASAQDLPACGRYPVADDTYTCACPANAPTRSAWGSGPYTADSDICTAARHAGMITEEGGAVMAFKLDGMAEYPGSAMNGVTTSRWGRYNVSIAFAPVAAETEVAAGGTCSTLGPDVETRCTCEANGVNHAIWGAGPYTTDSDLCTAARHAGAIGLAGGEISVIRAPGLTSYKATERNGILSMEWGQYGESFIVNANN